MPYNATIIDTLVNILCDYENYFEWYFLLFLSLYCRWVFLPIILIFGYPSDLEYLFIIFVNIIIKWLTLPFNLILYFLGG